MIYIVTESGVNSRRLALNHAIRFEFYLNLAGCGLRF